MKSNTEFQQSFDGQSAALIIAEVFPEDSGEYECSVIRGSEELSSFSNLKVKGEMVCSFYELEVGASMIECSIHTVENLVLT